MIKQILLITCFFIFSQLSAAYLWYELENFPPMARHRSIAFSIGQKGYMGLGHINAGGISSESDDFWEYDPASDSWTQKANFPGGGRYGAVGFSIGKKGYVGTGDTGASFSDDFWEYNPLNNVWLAKPNVPGGVRCGAVGMSVGGKGYVGMGFGNDFYEYNPANDTWTAKSNFPGGGIDYMGAFPLGTKCYVGCGGSSGNATDNFWEYDPATDIWTAKALFPGGARFAPCSFAINGHGFI